MPGLSVLPATVQIAFGSLRHERLQPVVHRFAYAVFYLRLKMRATNLNAANSDINSEPRAKSCNRYLFAINRPALISFYDRDHGLGDGQSVRWIESLLEAAGIDDADGAIWLETFPRVLGYVFKPVSFWFCERADGQLRAIICEVNNTFKQKHVYLLAHSDHSLIKQGESLHALKSFYVSPFFKVEGFYRFRFMRKQDRSVARIDYLDDSGPLLFTSLSGKNKALTTLSALHAFFRYPFFTIGVIARIHWHALCLFVKRVSLIKLPPPPENQVTYLQKDTIDPSLLEVIPSQKTGVKQEIS